VRITKLCVGMPTLGSVRSETMYCVITSLFHTVAKTGCGIHLIFPAGGMCDDARRKCAQEALDIGASHLMFIDSDMVFPDNGIVTLASRDKQVIGANYNMRMKAGFSTVKMDDGQGNIVPMAGNLLPNTLFKCYAIATGFMLIETAVFRKITKPWFSYSYDEEGDYTRGEDVYFCEKVRGKGIEVWCDPTIRVGHIGEYVY